MELGNSGEKYYRWAFSDGITELTDRLSINEQQLYRTLWACGAPWTPFSGRQWQEGWASVMHKLSRIERPLTQEEAHQVTITMVSAEAISRCIPLDDETRSHWYNKMLTL